MNYIVNYVVMLIAAPPLWSSLSEAKADIAESVSGQCRETLNASISIRRKRDRQTG